MPLLASWPRGRRAVAAATTLAVAAGVPITFGVLYRGFPITDVELQARQVWVTNGPELLAGRLNRQIEELDASVQATAPELDVVQDGDDVFLHDLTGSTLERIDPAYTTLVQRADIPQDAEVSLGGSTLSVLDPEDGRLWVVNVSNELNFDPTAVEPDAELGAGAHAVVTTEGTTFAVSAEDDVLLSFESPGAKPISRQLDVPDGAQLSAVGERAVLLDPESDRVIFDDGRTQDLPEAGLRIQQVGADAPSVLVAVATGLAEVPMGGGAPTLIEADIPAQDAASAPVRLDGCVHGAWADAQRYLQRCGDGDPVPQTIEEPTAGDRLEFRVNRRVIALNNLDTGNAWLVKETLRLVENWDEVKPPEEQETEEESDEKSTQLSFEDTLAERTEQNRPPIPQPDSFGVRPGRTTILPVLDNDVDPDGDVLVITEFSTIPAEVGRLDVIDGGRSLQFTAGTATTGSTSFRYTVSDGREGGTAESTGDIRIVPLEQNSPPEQKTLAEVAVEAGQSIRYNVLRDFVDPDGDEIFLDSAAPASGDLVTTSPDGTMTFQHQSGELGRKSVAVVVSDGTATQTGTVTVRVEPGGSLGPIGVPDYAEAFVGDEVVIEPLDNDLSPNGAVLELLGVDEVPASATVTPNLEAQTVTVGSTQEGAVYFKYALKSVAATSVGLVRVEFRVPPPDGPPPVAVKDVAFLRPGEPTTVRVLDNDQSPTGQVLAVQRVDTSATQGEVSVEVLGNTTIRVSSSAALTEQTQFSYTVSDGQQSAVAGVTIVPVPPIVRRQPPIAVDDPVTVRAGDIVSAAVLDNDRHPDQAQLLLDPELVDTGTIGDGLVFVAGDEVRFQAPSTPGQYSAVYRVADQYGESATATVTFIVTPEDAESNRPPGPSPQTSRVFAGARVRIDVPLDRIDPDGDSVALVGYTTAPQLGRIVESAADYFVYEAYENVGGTDSFDYAVADTFGARSSGTIRIGVIPRPEQLAPPNAVDDSVEVRPLKVASVEPLLNDSDPQGFTIALGAELVDVPEGIEAEVDGDKVIITAGEEEGGYSIRYQISNGEGGVDYAFIVVKVTEDAETRFPTAQDYQVPIDDTLGEDAVVVDVSGLINNPNGRDRDLELSTEGPNAADAEVSETGQKVTVHPGERRFAVAYRVTDPDDPDLTATAFIVVPAAVGEGYAAPPYLDPDLPPQVVDMNGEIEWKLEDIIVVPSGADPLLANRAAVTANVSDGSPIGIDDTTLRYVPPEDFRGQVTIIFDVTDGQSPDDPTGQVAPISLPLTVGDPDQKDVRPTFTTFELQIEAGEPVPAIELRDATGHPNRSVISEFGYSLTGGQTEDISVGLSGSTLSVSSPFGVQPGTRTTATFDITYRDYVVPGSVDIVVVPSTRPKAQAVTDEEKGQRNVRSTVNVLENDFNPFQQDGIPLRVIEAEVENSAATSARVTSTPEGEITVDPDASFIGVVSVVYTVEDATEDPSRHVQGRLLLNVRDRPDQIQPAPEIKAEGDQQVQIAWRTPATNGEPILDYTVSWTGTNGGANGRVTLPASAAGYTATGLKNGGHYTFSVTARNVLGDSTASPQSAVAIPFGTPFPPPSASISATTNGNGQLTMNWSAADGNGRDVTKYRWTVSPGGATGETAGTVRSATWAGTVGTAYRVSVVAIGPTGLTSSATQSGTATPTPGAPGNPTATRGARGDDTIRMTWNAAAANGVGAGQVGYEVRIFRQGDGWSSWRAGSSPDSYTVGFERDTRFEVRAVVNNVRGPEATSNTTQALPVLPPPEPDGRIAKGPSRACGSGGSGCAEVRVYYENVQGGTYQIEALINGSPCCSYAGPYTISGGSGMVQIQNHLGVRNNEQISVRFRGPENFTVGPISSATWNNLPYNG